MSKENVLLFMMNKDKNENLKSAYDSVLSKHQGKNLSEDEWDGVLIEEIIPLAKKCGFDFTPEDLKELQKPAEGELSDKELDGVNGGRGEITLTFRNRYHHTMTYKAYCDYAPDDQTFRMRYDQYPTDCPNYVPYGNYDRICMRCANCRVEM
jgi:hypothetical protein